MRSDDAGVSTERARALRVLVAEDNEDGRDMMQLLLESEGHTVVTAPDGPGAVAAAEAFRPEVAILDIGLPGLNGYKVAMAIRQSPAGAEMVLIAVSGLGQDEDKRRAFESGFDLHFTKPVDITRLSELLVAVGAGRVRPGGLTSQ